MTGGSLYHYHPFSSILDHQEVVNDLLWNVQREQGMEGLMRVRCSQGVDVEFHYGSFLRHDTGELSLTSLLLCVWKSLLTTIPPPATSLTLMQTLLLSRRSIPASS
jgi:hypothetical protein